MLCHIMNGKLGPTFHADSLIKTVWPNFHYSGGVYIHLQVYYYLFLKVNFLLTSSTNSPIFLQIDQYPKFIGRLLPQYKIAKPLNLSLKYHTPAHSGF